MVFLEGFHIGLFGVAKGLKALPESAKKVGRQPAVALDRTTEIFD